MTSYGRVVTSTRTDRWLHLDGTTNTRDLGGLPTVDGGETVFGRVLRSDNLQTLSEADVATLVDEVGLTEVVDLRTTAEVLMEGRSPLRDVDTVTHRHFTLLPERGRRTDVFAVEEDDEEIRAQLPDDWAESILPRQVGARGRGRAAGGAFLPGLPDRRHRQRAGRPAHAGLRRAGGGGGPLRGRQGPHRGRLRAGPGRGRGRAARRSSPTTRRPPR